MSIPSRGSSSPKNVQRVASGVKILLDIAKETSDAFPPLKSALGCVNALIKHYEEYKNVREKVEQLALRLAKLNNLMAITIDLNPEEQKRREELSSSLEEIRTRAQAISGKEEKEKEKTAGFLDKAKEKTTEFLDKAKEKTAGFLDKGKHSQEVVDLIEKLQDAVVYYQLSQQQSIYNQMGQLPSFFDKLLTLHKKSPMTKGKIEAAFARLDKLGSGKNNEDAVNAQDSRQRVNMFTTLEQIKHKLQEVLDRVEAVDYTENEKDVQIVSELMDDIRDAVIDYQTAHQQAIYDQNLKQIDFAELGVLNSIQRACGAGHEHRRRHGCLKRTRVAVLDEIEQWAENSGRLPIFWLSGLAGTGKSTIAKTVAERCLANDTLGASFFFCSSDVASRKRDDTLKNHDNPGVLFPTLAFQLAQKYPKVRSILVPYLQSDPDIVHKSPMSQVEELIIKPLQAAEVAMVIVIDALDECKDTESSSEILSALERVVSEAPNVRFFITSRPEPQIKCCFGRLMNITEAFALRDTAPHPNNNDIRIFLGHELSELATRKNLKIWPTEKQLDLLCDRAGGHFAYAVATVKFLSQKGKLPNKRYTKIEHSRGDTSYEGKMERIHGELSLDSLCTSILQVSFPNTEDDATLRSVLAAALFAPQFSPTAIPRTVRAQTGEDLDVDEVMDFLKSIYSLLELHEDPDRPVLPFHKLLPDCLSNPDRCPDTRFLVSGCTVSASS